MKNRFTRNDITPGKFVEFSNDNEIRIGKVIAVRGSVISLVLAPYKVRGSHKGIRKRIKKHQVTGIVHYKKVRRFDEHKKSRKYVTRGKL